MEEIFATKIIINEVLNIKDFEIPLSETERRHLIITGKNGSGKTTVLRHLISYIENVTIYDVRNNSNQTTRLNNLLERRNNSNSAAQIANYNFEIESLQKWLFDNINKVNFFTATVIEISNPILIPSSYLSGDFIFAFFEAKRNTELIAPSGIKKFDIKPYYEIEDKAGKDFIQHMVNLKADRLFAQEENEVEEPKKIDDWFTDFEERILDIFDATGSQLQFDRKNYNFNIVEPGKEAYNLNQLSDGYSSILNIVSELIMRMEEHKVKNYDVQGIVLIDEIETHLHIDLQKKILPFLTSFFPKIQFIVTTHSPFVITSIKNAVVCDLEKKIVINEDLSGYSYDAIIEGYFDSDKYSNRLKNEVAEFETLMSKDMLNKTEDTRLRQLRKYLQEIPEFLSDELTVKLQQIEARKLNKAS